MLIQMEWIQQTIVLSNTLLFVPHLDARISIQVSSFATDAGGGEGTKESCANKFDTAYGEMMFTIWYVITCMLHAHSKPLELVWIAAFGEFGNGNKTMSQFVYGCWYIQYKQKMGYSKRLGNKLLVQNGLEIF